MFPDLMTVQGGQVLVAGPAQLPLVPIDKQNTVRENAHESYPSHAANPFPPSAAVALLFLDTSMFARPRRGPAGDIPNRAGAKFKRAAFDCARIQRRRCRTEKGAPRAAAVSPHRGNPNVPSPGI